MAALSAVEAAERRTAGRDGVNETEPATLRTEFEFLLPNGYVDGGGTVHRRGVMRMATARDELLPLHDDRVRENGAYLTVVLLSRVITQLGSLSDIHPGIVENMFAADVAFLQDLYKQINQEGHSRVMARCPACQHEFSVDVAGGRLGES